MSRVHSLAHNGCVPKWLNSILCRALCFLLFPSTSTQRLRSQLEEAREKAERLETKKTEVLRSLRENAAHQRLEVLDAELERGRRTVAELQKVVDEEKKKCDPNVIKAVCLGLADQVNDKLKDLAKQRRQNERESILRDGGKMCSLFSYGLA